MIDRLIVAGGGTGGHLFPGLAVVDELRRRNPSIEVLFVGTERGIESRVLPKRNERLEVLEITPLKGQSSAAFAQSMLRIPSAMLKSAALVRRFNPDVVLGVGGYAAGPVLAAAATLGKKTALLEQNAHVGLTNRLLASVVGRAYLTFEQTVEKFGADKARVCGNPVRKEFVDAARKAAADPEGFEARANTVLVIGGSQGAKALNETVPGALSHLGLAAGDLRVVHQTGVSMRSEVEARYRELGVAADVVSFIDDIAAAFSRAKLVIARAGATTLAELCAVGRPSILIPFPHASDDHQTKNARALASQGAAFCIAESELSVASLSAAVEQVLGSPSVRRAMATKARAHGRPDAARAIVDDLLSWTSGGGQPTRGGQTQEPSAESTSSLRGARPYVPNVPARRSSVRPLVGKRPLWVDDTIWE